MALIIPDCPADQRAIAKSRFALGVDLGQSIDPTAISILEHVRVQHMRADGVITATHQRYDVIFLERLPLLVSYVDQVAEVGKLLQREPLAGAGVELVIDQTGPGASVGDMFAFAGARPTRITITGGTENTCVGPDRWHCAKSALVSLLDARMHDGTLRFAADLTEGGALKEELVDFQRKLTAAGRFTFSARSGKHDDLVVSVSIALWALAGRPLQPPAAFGVYSNTIPNATTYGGHNEL